MYTVILHILNVKRPQRVEIGGTFQNPPPSYRNSHLWDNNPAGCVIEFQNDTLWQSVHARFIL
jgi:hypothetical protein